MYLGIGYQNWLVVGATLVVAILILIKAIYYYRYFERHLPTESCGGCIGVFMGFFVGTGSMLCWILFGYVRDSESFWLLYVIWIVYALGVGGVGLLMARHQYKKATEDHPNKANDSLKKLKKQIKKNRPKTK